MGAIRAQIVTGQYGTVLFLRRLQAFGVSIHIAGSSHKAPIMPISQ